MGQHKGPQLKDTGQPLCTQDHGRTFLDCTRTLRSRFLSTVEEPFLDSIDQIIGPTAPSC
jgi:hypothetical protein